MTWQHTTITSETVERNESNSSNDALPEYESGYEDAPRLYWWLVGHYRGWKGDLTLWVTLLLLGFVIGLGLATLGLWWATA